MLWADFSRPRGALREFCLSLSLCLSACLFSVLLFIYRYLFLSGCRHSVHWTLHNNQLHHFLLLLFLSSFHLSRPFLICNFLKFPVTIKFGQLCNRIAKVHSFITLTLLFQCTITITCGYICKLEEQNVGVEFGPQKICALAYADDLVLVSSSHDDQHLVRVIDSHISLTSILLSIPGILYL